jgi:hypothetical protein
MHGMATSGGVSISSLARSGLVLAGLLLLGVGIGDTIAGRSKIAQYEELVRTTAASVAPRDPAALFPTASEGSERHELARAKLAFYQLLLTAGQLLSAVGFALLALGVLRVLRQAPSRPSRIDFHRSGV